MRQRVGVIAIAMVAGWVGACQHHPAYEPVQESVPAYALNPALLDLPEDRWIKIHQQGPDDAVTFTRQAHGGSAFDSRRGQLVLFGSDTHATNDFSNSPFLFDLQRLQWRRLYPDDDLATYKVTVEGLPVAGPQGDHPWAMHTFGALSYDPAADALVVASYPAHMVPGRFTDDLAHLWTKVRYHPTWVLSLPTGKWETLEGKPVHFFPYATAFDSHRGVVLGYRHDGIYQLALAKGQWQKVADKGLLGWGNNAVYHSHDKALVVFGSHERRNDIVVYETVTGRHRMMPTPGVRPPGAVYVPMAYQPDIGRTVAIVDRKPSLDTRDRNKMRAETWLYDLDSDSWMQIEEATLPFGVGMNYNLEFDTGHRLLLLVTAPPDEPVAVWALRLKNPANDAEDLVG